MGRPEHRAGGGQALPGTLLARLPLTQLKPPPLSKSGRRVRHRGSSLPALPRRVCTLAPPRRVDKRAGLSSAAEICALLSNKEYLCPSASAKNSPVDFASARVAQTERKPQQQTRALGTGAAVTAAGEGAG